MEPTYPRIRRIAIVGPESSGKTTLCVALAQAFHTVWVPEFARAYVAGLGRPYTFDDLQYIGQQQMLLENRLTAEAVAEGKAIIFYDTELISIKVWSDYCYGRTATWISEQIRLTTYDLYLLLRPDLPWEPDPLRENPDDRELLYSRFEAELRQAGRPYRVISGAGEQRRQAAMNNILPLLPANNKL